MRFISAEDGYLAPSNDSPVMYLNIEDHLSYDTGKVNQEFQVRTRHLVLELFSRFGNPDLDCQICLVKAI
jgi:hypothetical protein